MKTRTEQKFSDLNSDKSEPGTVHSEKRAWEDPKLTFVEPKLTRHGELERFTGGFFGTFSP